MAHDGRRNPLTLFGFFIGSPFAFLSPLTFWPAFQRFTGLCVIPITGSVWEKFTFPWRLPFRYALGLPLEIVCIVAVFWHMLKGKRSPVILLWLLAFLACTLATGSFPSSARVLAVLPAMLLLAEK